MKMMSNYPPSSITTDKLASYPKAFRHLQDEGLLSNNVEHRTSKGAVMAGWRPFGNVIVEGDWAKRGGCRSYRDR
jgi:hypothetical protein